MEAVVDKELCIGCELCVEICPEVFEMDGDKATVREHPLTPEDEATCRDAAEQCPVTAITIQE